MSTNWLLKQSYDVGTIIILIFLKEADKVKATYLVKAKVHS